MKQLLTTQEVAGALRQSVTTIQRWSKSKALPAVKIGRRLLFNEADIKNWLERKRLAGLSEWSREHSKKQGFYKMSEAEIARKVHQNRKG
jgi:excisionase family DNA binding protein